MRAPARKAKQDATREYTPGYCLSTIGLRHKPDVRPRARVAAREQSGRNDRPPSSGAPDRIIQPALSSVPDQRVPATKNSSVSHPAAGRE